MEKQQLSVIMKAAWMFARKLATKHNKGKASDYISTAMKSAWKAYRQDAERLNKLVARLESEEATKTAYENSIVMPEWFIKKQRQEGIEADKFNNNFIVRQTEKAVLISNNIEDKDHPEFQMWVPKSIILNPEVLNK